MSNRYLGVTAQTEMREGVMKGEDMCGISSRLFDQVGVVYGATER